MRKAIPVIAVSCFSAMLVSSAFGADKVSPYKKPSISFSQSPFTIVYGRTITLCATVTPASKAALFTSPSAWTNDTDAAGVFTTTPGTDQSCSGAGKVFLTIKSNADKCLAQGKVRAVLKNRNVFVEVAAVTGNVTLPNKETMANMNAPLRDCSIFPGVASSPWDYMDQWLATFKKDDANLDLLDVPFSEKHVVLTNNCSGSVGSRLPPGTEVGPNGDTLPGGGAALSNQWIDLIGFCGASLNELELPPANCSVTRRQTVFVGACEIQKNIQTITFSPAGAVSTNRVAEVVNP